MKSASRVILVLMLASMIGVDVDPAWLSRENGVSRTASWTDRVATTIRAAARPVTPAREAIPHRTPVALAEIETRSLAPYRLHESQLHLPPPSHC
jgi:hypothetical protein